MTTTQESPLSPIQSADPQRLRARRKIVSSATPSPHSPPPSEPAPPTRSWDHDRRQRAASWSSFDGVVQRTASGRLHRRDAAEMLVARARFLLPEDAALVQAVYGEGLSVTAIATNLPKRASDDHAAEDYPPTCAPSPRSVRRRLQRLVTRITSARFLTALDLLDAMPPTRRRVARACVLQGMTMRQAAARLGLSYHSIRRHMDAVSALCDAPRRPSTTGQRPTLRDDTEDE